jgi:hypothetical protein
MFGRIASNLGQLLTFLEIQNGGRRHLGFFKFAFLTRGIDIG